MPSSVVSSFQYDSENRQLAITFVSGRRYAYADVPPVVAERMRRATSKGTFFNTRVRDRYAFERLR